MQELKKSKSRKITNLDQQCSKKSINSDNLHVSLTPSTFRKNKPSASRPSTANSRSGVYELRKSVKKREELVRLSDSPPPPAEVPDNVAVHFSSFYKNDELQKLPHSVDKKVLEVSKTSRYSPKMEFTRQMVYKLEHSAGSQNYERQVSSLLENTVEAPEFDLKLPPVDNCAPYFSKSNDNFPLWYKDPNKLPKISRQLFQELKNRYNKTPIKRIKKIGKIKSSNESSGTEIEPEIKTESEEYENDSRYNNERKFHSAKMISKSSTSTIDKKFEGKENSVYNFSTKSGISLNFSERSWSSEETETEEEDDDENSDDWETSEEEDRMIDMKTNSKRATITTK